MRNPEHAPVPFLFALILRSTACWFFVALDAVRPTGRLLPLAVFSVCLNIILMLVKIGVGVVGNSYALIADGIESAGDVITTLITWAGFYIALRPADEKHPFGHGRFESLTGLLSGLSLVGASLFIGYHAVAEIRTPHHMPAWYTLPVLLLIVAAKEFASRRIRAVASDLESRALEGDAWHHRYDAIT